MASFHEGNETQKRTLPKGELLMTKDEKVELAKRLAENLQIKRSEWQRWVNYLRQCGDLDKALKLAEHLSRSSSIRREPKSANAKIKSALSNNIAKLRNLTISDLSEIFGYVSWWLEWMSLTGTRGGGERTR
jgi:geranylgeranyl pyrophosphate synthase